MSTCPACGTPCLACSQRSHADTKAAFHAKYLAAFRALAKLLGLPKGKYDLRSNKAGPAVMGEVVFHTDYAYAQTVYRDYADEVGEKSSLLVRACRDRKDYTGFENRYYPLSVLEGDMREALAIFRNLKKQKEVVKTMQGANPDAAYVHLNERKKGAAQP